MKSWPRSALARWRGEHMPVDLGVEYSCSTAALGGVFVYQVAIRQVVSLADELGQPAVHQCGIAAPQFLAPRPILGLPLEDLLQAEHREIFAPY